MKRTATLMAVAIVLVSTVLVLALVDPASATSRQANTSGANIPTALLLKYAKWFGIWCGVLFVLGFIRGATSSKRSNSATRAVVFIFGLVVGGIAFLVGMTMGTAIFGKSRTSSSKSDPSSVHDNSYGFVPSQSSLFPGQAYPPTPVMSGGNASGFGNGHSGDALPSDDYGYRTQSALGAMSDPAHQVGHGAPKNDNSFSGGLFTGRPTPPPTELPKPIAECVPTLDDLLADALQQSLVIAVPELPMVPTATTSPVLRSAGWYPMEGNLQFQEYWDGSAVTHRTQWDGNQWVPVTS